MHSILETSQKFNTNRNVEKSWLYNIEVQEGGVKLSLILGSIVYEGSWKFVTGLSKPRNYVEKWDLKDHLLDICRGWEGIQRLTKISWLEWSA